MVPYVHVGNTITFYIDGGPKPITSTHVNWRKIQDLISQGLELTNLEELLDVEELLYNGVYYSYEKGNDLVIAYVSDKDDIQYAKMIKSYQDFKDLKHADCKDINVPTDYIHHGTYATVDDLLLDYVERFL